MYVCTCVCVSSCTLAYACVNMWISVGRECQSKKRVPKKIKTIKIDLLMVFLKILLFTLLVIFCILLNNCEI